MTFRLSPSYGNLTAREAHDLFLSLMREHAEFEVETDQAGEWPVPFVSETVRRWWWSRVWFGARAPLLRSPHLAA